jgi:hypothetical protein
MSNVDEKTNIRRVCFKAVWPTAPRDFVICTTWSEQHDGSVIVATSSVSDDVCPPQKGFVRGSINISGYHIVPYSAATSSSHQPEIAALKSGECLLTLTAHSNLGGSLPASLINMLSTTAPLKIMNAIAAILQK